MTDLATTKAELRDVARQRRALAAGANPDAAGAIAKIILGSGAIPPGASVSAYAPIGDEIDPMPLLHALAPDHACCLPTIGDARTLVFRRWWQGMALVPGRYGIPVPPLDSPVILPDILLVPLLAFDRRGHRLGYGGGYYDTTLATLRANGTVKAIGLAYAAQEVDRLPAEAWDQAVDCVATERELMEFGGEMPG
jgi:5-formyltetrahydrofolate cyclo-ligase